MTDYVHPQLQVDGASKIKAITTIVFSWITLLGLAGCGFIEQAAENNESAPSAPTSAENTTTETTSTSEVSTSIETTNSAAETTSETTSETTTPEITFETTTPETNDPNQPTVETTTAKSTLPGTADFMDIEVVDNSDSDCRPDGWNLGADITIRNDVYPAYTCVFHKANKGIENGGYFEVNLAGNYTSFTGWIAIDEGPDQDGNFSAPGTVNYQFLDPTVLDQNDEMEPIHLVEVNFGQPQQVTFSVEGLTRLRIRAYPTQRNSQDLQIRTGLYNAKVER